MTCACRRPSTREPERRRFCCRTLRARRTARPVQRWKAGPALGRCSAPFHAKLASRLQRGGAYLQARPLGESRFADDKDDVVVIRAQAAEGQDLKRLLVGLHQPLLEAVVL